MTVMLTTSCWLTPRSKAGLITVIDVGVTLVVNASLAAWPLPGSKRTRTGARKFVPVMTTDWFPVGRPKAGVTLEMVGAVDGGTGGMTTSWKFSVMLFVTLLTVAVTTTGPATDEVTVALATPAVRGPMIGGGVWGGSGGFAFGDAGPESGARTFWTRGVFFVPRA